VIRKTDLIGELESRFIREEGRLSYDQSIKLPTYVWNEGVRFGVLSPEEPLEGIEADIRIAHVLNSCSKNSCPGFLKEV